MALIQTIFLTKGEWKQNAAINQSHAQIFLRADDFLREHETRPVYIDDLCAALDVCERQVQYAFQAVCDTSPMKYLRLRRLHLARRLLMSAPQKKISSVKQAALGSGFLDLGRFSVDYHKSFGETPSETLSHSIRRGAHV